MQQQIPICWVSLTLLGDFQLKVFGELCVAGNKAEFSLQDTLLSHYTISPVPWLLKIIITPMCFRLRLPDHSWKWDHCWLGSHLQHLTGSHLWLLCSAWLFLPLLSICRENAYSDFKILILMREECCNSIFPVLGCLISALSITGLLFVSVVAWLSSWVPFHRRDWGSFSGRNMPSALIPSSQGSECLLGFHMWATTVSIKPKSSHEGKSVFLYDEYPGDFSNSMHELQAAF